MSKLEGSYGLPSRILRDQETQTLRRSVGLEG